MNKHYHTEKINSHKILIWKGEGNNRSLGNCWADGRTTEKGRPGL